MKIANGLTNFLQIREEGAFYIDKTSYISKLEKLGHYLLLLRPPRFGKTLFAAMLQSYYDIFLSEQFEEIFQELQIVEEPTLLHSSYLVLKLDFSGINVSAGMEELKRQLCHKIGWSCTSFIQKYQDYFKDKPFLWDLDGVQEPSEIIRQLVAWASDSEYKIYLIIDEYDHFSDKLLCNSKIEDVHPIIAFMQTFFEELQSSSTIIDRIFITGTTPLLFNDAGRGFQMLRNITLESSLEGIMGFTDVELDAIVDQFEMDNNLPIGYERSTLTSQIQYNYSNYLFHTRGKSVYHPEMVLYLLQNLAETQEYPETLLDIHVKKDYQWYKNLFRSNNVLFCQMIFEQKITGSLFSEISYNTLEHKDQLLLLLFYLGLLTIQEKVRGKLILSIPNYAIQEFLWEYLFHELQITYKLPISAGDISNLVSDFAYSGHLEPLLKYMYNKILRPLHKVFSIHIDMLQVVLEMLIRVPKLYITHGYRSKEGCNYIFLEKTQNFWDIPNSWLCAIYHIENENPIYVEKLKRTAKNQMEDFLHKQFGDAFPGNLKKVTIFFINDGDFELEIL